MWKNGEFEETSSAGSAASGPTWRSPSAALVMSVVGPGRSHRRGRDRAGVGPRVAGAAVASVGCHGTISGSGMATGAVTSEPLAVPVRRKRVCCPGDVHGPLRVVPGSCGASGGWDCWLCSHSNHNTRWQVVC
jgi:hypothetical protein